MARITSPVQELDAGFGLVQNAYDPWVPWSDPPAPAPLAAPIVRNVRPAVGLSVRAADTLTLEVYAPNGLMRAIVSAQYDGMLLRETVHDGFSFGPAYLNPLCKVDSIAGGVRLTLWRSGGWPTSPTLLVIAYDVAGLEYASTLSWTLVGGPLGESPAVQG